MSNNIASVLNELVETSKDGEKGFRTAAEDTKNPELKTIFTQRAGDCAKGAAELQQIVMRMGGKPEQGGSVAGATDRDRSPRRRRRQGEVSQGARADVARGHSRGRPATV